MKSILISPPHIPTYINTDYNFVEIGEVAAQDARSRPARIADFGLSWLGHCRLQSRSFKTAAIAPAQADVSDRINIRPKNVSGNP